MRIEINEPQAIFELGQQPEQKDAIYPRKGEADQADRIFIVSDGHSATSLTSQQLTKNIAAYFRRYRNGNGDISDQDIMNAIATCRPEDGSELKGLSMVMLCLHNDGITVVSAGSCRVLQIRPSAKKIVFENAGSEKFSVLNPDIRHIDDVQPDDFFVVLTDGMLEQTDSNKICEFFSEEGSDDKKRNILRANTSSNKDNHSLYFFRVRSVIYEDGKDLNGRRNIVIPEIKSVKPVANSDYDDEDDDEEDVVTPTQMAEPEKDDAPKPQQPQTIQRPQPQRTQPQRPQPQRPQPQRPQRQRPTKNQGNGPRPISQYEEERHSTNVRMVILVAVIIVLAIAAGTLWYFNSSSPKTLPADSTSVETPVHTDTTAATPEPADSAMIPDSAVAEPARNIPAASERKRVEKPSYEENYGEGPSETETETPSAETPSTDQPAAHKAESSTSSSASSEPAKTDPAAPSTSAQ